MNDRRKLSDLIPSKGPGFIGPDRSVQTCDTVKVLNSGIIPSEREALFLEFRPMLRRLCGDNTEDNRLEPCASNPVYAKYCEIMDAYDPGRGFPIRPYILRNLTAIYEDGPESLRSAIAALPPAEREAVAMRYYYGRKVGEIAMRLGASVGAASALIDSGLSRLRASFGQQDQDK